jgi:uncharacterized protein (DUF58 family)
MRAKSVPPISRELLKKYAHTLDRVELVSRTAGRIAGSGRRPGAGTGYSVDFADYRKYHYGDDVRYVDWNIYARLRKLFLRQYRAEADLAVHILLDTSNSMSYGGVAKLDFAKTIAAAFCYVGLSRHDRVGLATFSEAPHRILPPRRGQHQLSYLLQMLDDVDAAGPSDFERAFSAYTARASTRGMAVVLSDFFSESGYQNALRCLAFGGFEVVVIRVLAAEELSPELEGEVELRDLEHGEMQGLVTSGSGIGSYLKAMSDYSNALSGFCMSEGFPYAETTSSCSFEKLSLQLLRAGIWRSQ